MSEVVYEMDLRDMLSKKIDEAGEHVKKFEGKFEHLKERGLNVLESIGFSFAAFEGYEFLKGAKEEFEEIERAQSQLQAGLESTGHAAGLSYEEITESAEKFSRQSKFTKEQIEDMQSILLTFTSVTNKTFDSASNAVLNMATRLKTDASSAALQLGKALQDPVAGLGALHRVGVNVEELRKQFIHTTSTLERQKLIIKELNTEFGGSFQAAAASDATFKFDKSMEELRETMGQLVVELTSALAPAFAWFVDAIKNSIEWMKEHKDLMRAIAWGVGAAAAAWAAYRLYVMGAAIATKLMGWAAAEAVVKIAAQTTAEGVASVSTNIFTGAVWALNVALEANPIGVVVAAIGILIAAITYAWHHFEWFRGGIMGTWEVIKLFSHLVIDQFKAVGKVIWGALTFNWNMVKEGWREGNETMHDLGHKIGSAFKKGYDEGVEDLHKEKEGDQSLIPKGVTFKAKPLGNGPAVKDPSTKMTGQKNITITVTIKSLIDHFNTNVTNIKESNAQLRDLIVQELASAVNDFQVVADH